MLVNPPGSKLLTMQKNSLVIIWDCNMKITYIYLGVIAILGWNAWAIQRDNQMLKVYSQTKAHYEYCQSFPTNYNCKK